MATHESQEIREGVIALVSHPISLTFIRQPLERLDGWSPEGWLESFALADSEGLANWYVHRVQSTGVGCPQHLLDSQRAKVNTAKMWAKFQAVLSTDAQTALQKANIDCRVYKGVALARALYGDATLRNSNDIDILVAPQNLKAAVVALKNIGFETSLDDRWLEHAQFLQGAREMQLSSMNDSFTIDLHWRLMCNWNGVGPVSEAELFSPGQPQLILGAVTLPWFTPSTLFRLQLAHVITSSWFGLKTFVDLAHVFDTLDEAAQFDVVQACKERGCIGALWASLQVLNKVFGRDTAAIAATCEPVRKTLPRWRNFANTASTRLLTCQSSAPESMDIVRAAWHSRTRRTVIWQLLQRMWTPTVFDYTEIGPSTTFPTRVGRTLFRHLKKSSPISKRRIDIRS